MFEVEERSGVGAGVQRAECCSMLPLASLSMSHFFFWKKRLNQAETGPLLEVLVPQAGEPAQLTIAHRIAIDFRLNSGCSLLV
jgi:hypothetical protein